MEEQNEKQTLGPIKKATIIEKDPEQVKKMSKTTMIWSLSVGGSILGLLLGFSIYGGILLANRGSSGTGMTISDKAGLYDENGRRLLDEEGCPLGEFSLTLSEQKLAISGVTGIAEQTKAISFPEFAVDEEGNVHRLKVISHAENPFLETSHNVKDLYFPSPIELIEENALTNLGSVESISLSSEATSFALEAYSISNNENLAEIAFPSNLTVLPENAITNNQSLTKLDFSATRLNRIEKGALANNESLSSVFLPSTITTIQSKVFENTALSRIDYAGTMDEWHAVNRGSEWLSGVTSLTVYCSDGPVEYYF